MKFNVIYRKPVGLHKTRSTVVPVDITDVSNIEWLLSQAEPSTMDSIAAADNPRGASNIGTLNRAQGMFPDADDILFA